VQGHTVACHWAEQIAAGELQPMSVEDALVGDVDPSP
jgi:hypothetical protein